MQEDGGKAGDGLAGKNWERKKPGNFFTAAPFRAPSNLARLTGLFLDTQIICNLFKLLSTALIEAMMISVSTPVPQRETPSGISILM